VTPGTQIGTYRIEALLGAGGMGTVYRALDTKLNRPVAIKFLSSEVADQAARRRFQREAEMASSLNHPHILTVYDAGEFEGQQYLVTELVDGGTLRSWAGEKRSWKQIVDLLSGVAGGLAAAHAAGILHRDIKPENVLVGRNGYAKLADFGLAKLAPITEADLTRTLTQSQTRPGMIVGTIPYMSPEQVSGHPVDARSDIFSFGVILYEALGGQRPFRGPTDLMVLQSIIHQPLEPLGDDVPLLLRIAVEKALDKDPADRYQTMSDLAVDLKRATRIRMAEPAPAATRSRLRTWWIVAAVLLVLAAGVSFWRFGKTSVPFENPFLNAHFTRLTDFPGFEEDAAISPDGKFVAFISDREGPYDIWLNQLATGHRSIIDSSTGKSSSGAKLRTRRRWLFASDSRW